MALAPIGIIGAIFLLVLILIVGIQVSIQWHVRNWRRKRSLRCEERVLDWLVVRQRLDNGQGCLLVEWGPHGPEETWWIKESLTECYPEIPLMRLSEFKELDVEQFYEKLADAELEKWANENLSSIIADANLVNVRRKVLMNIEKEYAGDQAFVLNSYWDGSPAMELRKA